MGEDTIKQYATILALATEVPETVLHQVNFSDGAADLLGLSAPQERLLKRIASGTQIQKRHSVVSDFSSEGFKGSFFGADTPLSMPGTGKRNDVYKATAPKLAESVCRSALHQWGGDPKAITHVISVSCTGMVAPGIEFLLIDRLNLSRDVQRLGINFMGCFGAFKGLAIAKALALEDPQHRILLVCTELCSLHFQADTQTDTMVANAIFADGAAAVVVGTHPLDSEKPLMEIHHHASAALEDTLDLMSWEAGDYGYQMRLSAAVPAYVEKHILPFTKRLVGGHFHAGQCEWAVHPGGRTILEAIVKGCGIESEQLSASWKVLNDYGNMSSATFLFVLKELLAMPTNDKTVVGLGFGPGLSIEGVLLKRVSGHVAG